jgi:hypothetical protein
LVGAVADREVAAHLRPAQVQVAVGQAQVLVDLVAPRVVEGKRRRLGGVEDLELRGVDLDLARGQRGFTVPSGRGTTLPETLITTRA